MLTQPNTIADEIDRAAPALVRAQLEISEIKRRHKLELQPHVERERAIRAAIDKLAGEHQGQTLLDMADC